MSYGPVTVFSGAIASGASTLTSVDLVKSWSKIYAQIPTMSTATNIDIWHSVDNTTFYPVMERVNTAPIQHQTFFVSATVGSGGGFAQLIAHGRYLQFRCTAVVSGGVNIKVICSD